MGFTVYYRSVSPVDADQRASAHSMCNDLCNDRTWLSCEPITFFPADSANRLHGGSKPNFVPHPDDTASTETEGLPDGTIQDALDVLCKLSAALGIQWEIRHDHSDGPIGFIREGKADPDVLSQIEAFGSVGDILGDLGLDGELEDGLGGLDLFNPDGE